MKTLEEKRDKFAGELLKLNRHDFETVIDYLVGYKTDEEEALKILSRIERVCPDYRTYYRIF